MRSRYQMFGLLICTLAIAVSHQVNAQQSRHPRTIVAAMPDYPEYARQIRGQGSVVVDVKVNRKGLVDSARIAWGPRLFAEAALEAARKWQFRRGLKTARLAFYFGITDRAEDARVSFMAPDRVEVITLAPTNLATRPDVIRWVVPAYPQIAVMAHASGIVEVKLQIDDAGKVLRATVGGGHPFLQATSVAAARQWTFSASTSKEERTVIVRFRFRPARNNENTPSYFKSPYELEVIRIPSIINRAGYAKNE